MEFPADFIKNVWAADGEHGRLWLSRLPVWIEELRSLWNLDSFSMRPDLSYGFVASARHEGRRVILKMTPPTRLAAREARWLKHYSALAPEVLRLDEERNAFLMECCDPGHSLLSDWEPIEDEAMTRRIAGIARVLRERNVKDDSYPHLAEQIPDLKSLSGIAEPYLLSKVESLFTDLTRNRSGDVLLHGDLHHGNILSDGDGWKVIDPHGYVGDPAAEIAVMIYNPLGKLPVGRDLAGFMDRRLHVLAEETGDDLVKIRAWCFCKTMLSAAWNAGDFRRQAERELALAAVLQ